MGNIIRKLREITNASKRATYTNGEENDLFTPEELEQYTNHGEIGAQLVHFEHTLAHLKPIKNKNRETKRLYRHMNTLIGSSRKYAKDIEKITDPIISRDDIKKSLKAAHEILKLLKNNHPLDEDERKKLHKNIDHCKSASKKLTQDIHKYKFKATIIAIAAAAALILSILLLTTLSGMIIPITVIGITLTAELISKVAVGLCFASAVGLSVPSMWLFTRKNDIARSLESVAKDAEKISNKLAAPAA